MAHTVSSRRRAKFETKCYMTALTAIPAQVEVFVLRTLFRNSASVPSISPIQRCNGVVDGTDDERRTTTLYLLLVRRNQSSNVVAVI